MSPWVVRSVAVGLLAVAVLGLGVPAAAAASSYEVHIAASGFTYAGRPLSQLTAAPGDHVRWANDTTLLYHLVVTRAGSTEFDAYLVPTTTSADWTVTAGTHQVTASTPTGPTLSMTVVGRQPSSSPSPSPSPSRAQTSPAPASPAPSPTVAPAPSKQAVAPVAPPPPPSAGSSVLPPPAAPAPSVVEPTPLPYPSAAVAKALGGGPREAPGSRGTGLPAAVSAVLVVGLLGALVRVLLAEPVDERRRAAGRTA